MNKRLHILAVSTLLTSVGFALPACSEVKSAENIVEKIVSIPVNAIPVSVGSINAAYGTTASLEAAAEARAEGIQISDWSLEERAKFRNIARSQWETVTKQSPIAKEYVDALVKFMNSQGLM